MVYVVFKIRFLESAQEKPDSKPERMNVLIKSFVGESHDDCVKYINDHPNEPALTILPVYNP
jgi:hypothetical protein